MVKCLDYAGLSYFLQKIRNLLSPLESGIAASNYSHIQQQALYGLQNNYCPNAIIEPMCTYIDNNDKLFYGGTGSTWVAYTYDDEEGMYVPKDIDGEVSNGVIKWPGSCSALVTAGIMGITYDNSRMVNGTAHISQSGSTALLQGGSNTYLAGKPFFSPQTYAAAATKYGSVQGWLHSWQMAHWLYDIGLLHHIDDDMDISVLRPGDLVFYENWTGTATHWQNINHVEVFVGFNTLADRTNMIVINGQSVENNYAAFDARPIPGVMASQLKWFARIPSSGVQPRNLIEKTFQPIHITGAGWNSINFDDGYVAHKNRAFTVIMTLDDAYKNYDTCHMNFWLYSSGSDHGTGGNIYLNSRFNQIGPNTFACVCRSDSYNTLTRIRLQFVDNMSVDFNITDLRVYDGIVSW